MTAKLKNRVHKMTFQKQTNRTIQTQDTEETKYYEQLYKEQTMELLGIKHENISTSTGRSLRPQYI